MNVSLPPELEQYIAAKVEKGTYQSASEVVRDGLRLLIERDELRQALLDRLNVDIQAGLDEIDRGQTVSSGEAFASVRRLSRERRSA
ncbi:MAG: type II toxin-antitoxin system ParD family antitoxin [Rhodospirillales bacterium]|jgi:antitoxin ParD1/3/4|nr:type II toxin-antitoxin system ParD family antitoxin [Rhodospirillales bacterium]